MEMPFLVKNRNIIGIYHDAEYYFHIPWYLHYRSEV